ncbi:MAG TPA: signal recognition particle protein [Thermoanaerobaculia bacterium]|jgi:signal recognition particle subunit SRP54|nr:signal recognition particle protein [Thermoanaerobaculia bacterium]
MFDGLQDKLQSVFRELKGEGRVSPEALDAALRQIRLALLEADVHFRVVKPFIERVRERALGQEVLESLTPAQQVVKIVRDELAALLGEEGTELRLDGRPAVILLCGLQGSGKTTTAGKLAKRLKKRGRHPLLVAGDLQRAAAVEQLKQVGQGVEVPVLEPEPGEKVTDLGARALSVARQRGHDVVLMDTAGRLHVDTALMEEIRQLADRIEPHEVLFVADSMTGQDAVKSAEQFAQVLPLTGAILTKLDGDSRGGAALSIRTVARVPIRYVGVGEKADDLELFHPERMASRMIGMGDVLSLIEKAERGLDAAETERLAKRMVSQQFTLEDLRDQLRQLRRMGPLASILEMLPKAGPLRGLDASNVDESGLRRVEAIIDSMTPLERRRPDVLNGSRKKRIAMGSGTSVSEINRLLKQYAQMRKMMKGVQGKWLRRAMGMGGPMARV